ncbi:hypothetical protein NDU88_006098, partial [Pleurodeles waltl]
MYVSKSGPSVLGWWDQGALGMVLNPNGSEPVSVVQEDCVCDATMKDMYPLVFSGTVGKLKSFQHKIILKKDAIPVVHKARNIPFSIRNEVSNELDKLLETGIIEQVESSDWISPLVVARRSNGRLRLCVDLRDLNKNI